MTMPYRFPKVRGGPRPVRPLHFYPARSQMMMISHQQLSFATSSQGYFIPAGQYRTVYMSPTQQYPVISGSAGFYPGTSEYPAFAGGYYPGQPEYATSVQPIVMSLNRHLQQSTPPQQLLAHSYSPRRTERKQIRIRDPNQGGRDITDEIMSGAKWSTTASTTAQSCVERGCPALPSDKVTQHDGNDQRHISADTASLPADPKALGEASQEPSLNLPPAAASEVNSPTAQGEQSSHSYVSLPASDAPSAKDEGDTVDAPHGPSAPPSPQEAVVKMGEQMECAPAARPLERQEKKIEKPMSRATKPFQPPPTKLELAQLQTWSEPRLISECEPVGSQAEIVEHHLSNGIHQDLFEESITSDPPPLNRTVETTALVKTAIPAQERNKEKRDNTVNYLSDSANAIHVVTFDKKRKRNMKDLNKRETVGDLLNIFTEQEQGSKTLSKHRSSLARLIPDPAKVAHEPWVQNGDEQNTEPNRAKITSGPNEQQKQLEPVKKKLYKREFLLSLQYISPSLKKPDGLPRICGVVMEKVNKTPLQHADSARSISFCPDFSPLYLGNFGGSSIGGLRSQPPWPRCTQLGQSNEPRKIISSLTLNGDVQLNKAEKAWKPSPKKPSSSYTEVEAEDDPEQVKSQQLLKRLRSILNKLTPEKFQELTKQVKELTIDTEERLKGAIDLIFEKAILEPNFCVAYANMCRCLRGLKLPTSEKSNFGKLLLNRCQKEFEKDQDDEILEKKQKELQAVKDDVERERLVVELDEARDKARRRSLGNIRFIGELFNLKMLTVPIMHDCVMKLLKERDEESMECLCMLLSTCGKNLDLKKAKPHVDQYFYQMEKIVKGGKTSSRIRFMLQDIMDLRKNNWVPRRGDQGPKTIEQIHKEAKMEEQREQIKVQQQLLSKKEAVSKLGADVCGRGAHTLGGNRTPQPQDEALNTVTKNGPVDAASHHCKISKTTALEFNNVLLAPGVKCLWGSWGKGCLAGGEEVKPVIGDQNLGHLTSSSLNPYSVLQHPGPSLYSADSDQVPQRSNSSCELGGDKDRGDRSRDRFQRFYHCKGRQGRDERNSHNQNSKRSFIRALQEPKERARDILDSIESKGSGAYMTKDQDRASIDIGSGDRGPIRDLTAKYRCFPAFSSLSKPALTVQEVERKSNAIIGEYLIINDLTEALQCVTELRSASLLYVFVRNGIELTLEHSTVARERVGLLLHHLVRAGTLSAQQYFKGLEEVLADAEDMAIDIPHFWYYLAELITPMLHEGGIPMGQLLREICKPLVPQGQAGVMLVRILKVLCKEMTPKEVGSMWTAAGLNWSDFLPKNLDINKFVTDQQVDFTVGGKTKLYSTSRHH